jgi:hypothetical protein
MIYSLYRCLEAQLSCNVRSSPIDVVSARRMHVLVTMLILFSLSSLVAQGRSNYTVVGNHSDWVQYLSGMEMAPILDSILMNPTTNTNGSSLNVSNTTMPPPWVSMLAQIWSESPLQLTLTQTTSMWSANDTGGAVFLHESYVVAYLQATRSGHGVNSFTHSSGGDRASVIVFPSCPYQYVAPYYFSANRTAVPPLCVQSTPLIAVRPYLLELVRLHLHLLMQQGATLFEYVGAV